MANEHKAPDEIEMKSRYPGKCYNCGYAIDIGTKIKFNTVKRVASHVECKKPDYSGAEQVKLFEMWVQRAQESDVNNG
jgi:hypothetical protein